MTSTGKRISGEDAVPEQEPYERNIILARLVGVAR
jgi:hypothetical protein